MGRLLRSLKQLMPETNFRSTAIWSSPDRSKHCEIQTTFPARESPIRTHRPFNYIRQTANEHSTRASVNLMQSYNFDQSFLSRFSPSMFSALNKYFHSWKPEQKLGATIYSQTLSPTKAGEISSSSPGSSLAGVKGGERAWGWGWGSQVC